MGIIGIPRKDDNEVAVKVRMGFSSLIDFMFVMGFLLIAVIKMIPSVMNSYTDYTPWIGVPLIAMFCLFLWRLGTMIVSYVNLYLDTRSVHGEIVATMKTVVGNISMRGNLGGVKMAKAVEGDIAKRIVEDE